MDLTDILQELKIKDASAPEGLPGLSSCPVAEVLCQIQERFDDKGSAEHRPNILKSTERLFSNGDVHWLFDDANSDLRSVYEELLESLIQYAALPVCETDSGTLPEDRYEDIPAKAQAVNATLLTLSRRLENAAESLASSGESTFVRTLTRSLAPILCTFAVTHLQNQPWTNEASRRDALELLTSVVRATGGGSVLDLLCGKSGGDQRGVLGSILDTLQPELTKDKWKQNQALKHVFSWLLVQVGRPWLADYLEKVFPPSLLISDDYRTENKVLGVHCLHHIIQNVPAADLRQYNRAQVLYHALFNHLYTPEAPLIQVVLPCIIDLLAVLEKRPAHTGLPRKPNRYDEVLRLVLTHMEMEHKLALRRIYASNLVIFIEKMGIVIARHLKRLEKVIVGYLEISDGPEEKARISILDALEKLLQIAWPRMECRMGVLTRSLLRFLCDVESEPLAPKLREELMNRASRCLMLLDRCTEGKLKEQLVEVDGSCVSDAVLKCIQTVTLVQED
ncbi:TELO2-interacting protein 2 [Chanos chanos]|uniref:TELO2-interacting protein 2 n=1 Tax=Chanos chanos TaxID=29144 RepID=A0A6J2WDA9_CHACN|nr:TELO2-interacting protein 2 [Chanos chanos]